jgi:hypothetical protein
MDDGRLELIDGQLRLTTLFLILRHIQEHLPSAKLNYSLEYQIPRQCGVPSLLTAKLVDITDTHSPKTREAPRRSRRPPSLA